MTMKTSARPPVDKQPLEAPTESFKLGNHVFQSRMIVGTGKYETFDLMRDAIDLSGAVTDVTSPSKKNRVIPVATIAPYARSRFDARSPSNTGPASNTYSGAVDWRKIALAAVVSLFATTNMIIVAA